MAKQRQLDMTMMYAFHDALRRDLKQIAQMETRSDGWDLFESLLQVHHTAEDDALWPAVREAVAGRPDDLVLLEDMVEEHASLGPLLETIDEALGHGDSAASARAELAERLQQHLEREENSALPLGADPAIPTHSSSPRWATSRCSPRHGRCAKTAPSSASASSTRWRPIPRASGAA